MSEPSIQSSPPERPKIRVLPDRVVNQIAAGEVIERPAAVVKELLENALDARADRIEIEFSNGGKSLIRVEDNGIGMSPDEALISLERHATSKLREAADLGMVTSLGFRGEALPSIASVSRFTLRTRPAGWDHGSEIFINGGKMIHQRECGMAQGTRIEVAHLFNSVPARRKFLKTDNTEAAHITHLVRLHAVARPGVAFTLLENGRKVFASPKCPAIQDRVAEIWGRQLAEDLVELEPIEAESGMRLYGLVGKPGTGRATRRELVTLVNGRPVDSRTLGYALIEGYHSFIPKGRYPLAFLFLEIDPAAVDVNIHPAKREIKFRDEGRVRQFVLRAVQEKLQSLARHLRLPPMHTPRPADDYEKDVHPYRDARKAPPATTPLLSPLPQPAIRPEPAQEQQTKQSNEPSTYPRTHPGVVSADFKKQYLDADKAEAVPAEGNNDTPPKAPAEEAGGEERPTVKGDAPDAAAPTEFHFNWRCLGMLREGYVLFETPDGLVFMNRRAAHERVWFERLQDRFQAAEQPQQQLLFPIALELEPLAATALQDNLATLQAHGFGIEPFGRNFYRVASHPDWLPEGEAETFIRDMIERLREGSLDLSRPEVADESLARLAVTRALKPSDDAGVEEMSELARVLLQCRQPLNCPRGRPTYFELSQRELARRFGA